MEPGVITVTSPVELFTVATEVFELVKEKVPLLVVVGRVSTNAVAPYVLLAITKSPNTGVARSIVSTDTTLAAVWFVPLACVMVRVVTPVLTIVTRPVVASIVAAAGLLLVNVMAPSLGEVPQFHRKDESPNSFEMGSSRSNAGVARPT